MTFYVCELTTMVDGSQKNVNPFAFATRDQAEAKYHQILSGAATSSVDKKGAILFNEDGFVLKNEVYNHYVPPVPPEPEPEENTAE